MKLFNSVKAGVSGTVEQILVGDGKPVTHDEVLMLIRPQANN
jgi:acetyl-CoA carboxylase biotin carboxyl carrier protein